MNFPEEILDTSIYIETAKRLEERMKTENRTTTTMRELREIRDEIRAE